MLLIFEFGWSRSQPPMTNTKPGDDMPRQVPHVADRALRGSRIDHAQPAARSRQGCL